MKSRNTITVGLMAVSILLLLMLQTLWLRSSYEKAFYDLRRDMNYVFRNTLFGIRDSLFVKNIKPMELDTLQLIPAEKIQTVSVIKRNNNADSIRVNMHSSSVQVYVKGEGDNDSITKALQPLARHFGAQRQEGKSFVIRLADDTIKIDTLKTVFTKALQVANYPTSFLLKHNVVTERLIKSPMELSSNEHSMKERPNIFSDTMHLESVRLNPVSRYSASFPNIKTYVLKEITPQIIFSLLLTFTIIGAFVVLYRSLRTQQRLMELKNDFISNVTHELKTPVATVSVALEALKNFHAMNDPQRTKEYLEIAQSELNRLTLMTDKILKASSFEKNGVDIQKESVDLEKIVNQILESMKLVFEKHQAQISFTKEGLDFLMQGSITHITAVIYNLVDNALKYSPENPAIAIALRDKNQTLEFEVRDNGIGIPDEYKTKIFEKFFRVPTGDIHNIKGYGLGLSYVSSVVKEHNGRIEVTSNATRGSTFTVQLPKQLV